MVLLALAAAGCGLGVTGSMAEPDAGFPERGEPDAGLEAAASMAEAAVDAGAVTSVGSTTVASMPADLAKPADGAIQTDGQKDGVFDVTVSGPAIALALLLTDANGKSTGNQIWDTWVGTDPIPASLGTIFVVGSSTYQLAVLENGARLNDASGRVSLAPGPHALRIGGSSVGSFAAGNHFRVIAQAPDGSVVQGPVLTY